MKNYKRYKSILAELRVIKILNRLVEQRRKGYVGIKLSGCAVCGSRYRIEIHHVNYVEDITMYLCRRCHKRVHFGKGLEHLNPVGKKLWLEPSTRIERDARIGLTTDELIFSNYMRLLKEIFRVRSKTETRQKIRIMAKGYIKD